MWSKKTLSVVVVTVKVITELCKISMPVSGTLVYQFILFIVQIKKTDFYQFTLIRLPNNK